MRIAAVRLTLVALAASVSLACSARAPAAPVRHGLITEVQPGGSIAAAVDGSPDGGTVIVHAGSYPRTTLRRQARSRIVVTAAKGQTVTVAGFTVDGAANLTIRGFATTDETTIRGSSHDVVVDGVSCTVTGSSSLGDPNCFLIHSPARAISLRGIRARGGWDGVKVYSNGSFSDWARKISVVNSNIAGAHEDDLHIDGVDGMLVAHNVIHDPGPNELHNDGIQSQASNGLEVLQNRFYFTVVSGGNIGQAIILGNEPAEFPDRKVTNSRVRNNLVAHWNGGRALIVNGTENTAIVNNTLLDNGDPSIASITVANQGSAGGQNPGLQIWNNILTSIYYDGGSQRAAFCDSNLVTHPYNGMSGTNVIHADPHFAATKAYVPGAHSPAGTHGLARPGTPNVDLNGEARSTPPGLGAFVAAAAKKQSKKAKHG